MGISWEENILKKSFAISTDFLVSGTSRSQFRLELKTDLSDSVPDETFKLALLTLTNWFLVGDTLRLTIVRLCRDNFCTGLLAICASLRSTGQYCTSRCFRKRKVMKRISKSGPLLPLSAHSWGLNPDGNCSQLHDTSSREMLAECALRILNLEFFCLDCGG